MADIATETSLALIQKDLKYMTTGIDEVKVGIKEINARFATKEEVEERMKTIEKTAQNEIEALKSKISLLEKGVWSAVAFILYNLGTIAFKLIAK